MEQIIRYSESELCNICKLLQIPGDRLHMHDAFSQDRDVPLGKVLFPDGAMVDMKVVIPYSRDYPYIQAQFYTTCGEPTDMEIRGEWPGVWDFNDREQLYRVQIVSADEEL